MDDQQAYLLNGLLTRNFGLGRIVRFREVGRGRQAQTFEILTYQQHEYTVYLYPPSFGVGQLNFAAGAINVLDGQRFSVVPMLRVKGLQEAGAGEFVAEGPQGGSMLVSLTTTGSAMPAEQYTEHDLSQLGLRLGWLHRLLGEEVRAPGEVASLGVRVGEQLDRAGPESLRHLPAIAGEARENLMGLLRLEAGEGWVHGDVHPAALLVDSDHQLRTVVDFGLLHWGCPLEDLVDALLHFCVDGSGGFEVVRARAVLEAYDSLRPLKNLAWTPVVGRWLGQRVLDAGGRRRGLPRAFGKFLARPEDLATGIASCI